MAFSIIKDEIVEDFVHVGKLLESEFKKLTKVVQELGVEDRVHFMGFVSDKELSSYYGCATALVFLSSYEGFGLPPLQAMAHGCPVIASNLSSIPEVVGDSGVLVQPENTKEVAKYLHDLSNNQVLRNSFVQKSRQRALSFSWDEVARQTF